MNLYYLHFNNYYNRIIKKFDTPAEYLVESYYDNVFTKDIAFNPNDGVTTKQVANIPTDTFFDYDYAILVDGNEIKSRWFILEAKRNLNGQFSLMLKRDLFADSYEGVLDAPAFIEKATMNANDPLIFNKEDMTFNQIKKSETLLKDETKCPWIVGYIARNDATGVRQDYNISFTPKTSIDFSVESIEDWELYKDYGNYSTPFVSEYNCQYRIEYYKDSNTVVRQWFNKNGIKSIDEAYNTTNSSLIYPDNFYDNSNDIIELANQLDNEIPNIFETHTQEQMSEFLNINGKVVYDISTGFVFRIKLIPSTINKLGFIRPDNISVNLYNIFKSKIPQGNEYSFMYDCKPITGYFISLEIISKNISQDTYTLNIGDRFNLEEAPYDMFCIPYTNDLEIFEEGELQSATSKEIAFNAAMELARKYGNDAAKSLYDLQLLPYCPVRYAIQEDGTLDVGGNELGITYVLDSNNQKVCPVFFASNDSFTLNIALENPIVITDYKVESQCDMYRLCSPNYNGVFEFNAAKNYGVSYFNVDCTYKPYNPYIHVNPNFDGLYGKDFNDSRGLVVGGDFSLPQTTSAWESYQLSNKNFQASFDRQITNMEVNNNIQMSKAVANAAVGVVGGVLGGLTSGGIGGAIAGGVASAVGGAADVAMTKIAQNEAIDYTKDQFGYSLGNIQALPQGLSKTTALVYNNKLFPFLEYYTCTEQEKNALKNKIKYNGMTVMRIGTIREFLQQDKSYIKGKFIRFENIQEDFHYVNELANEFNKGVFI
jgi:hypothetical protein